MDKQQIIVAVLATLAVAGLGIAFLEPILSGASRAEKRQAAYAQPRAKRRVVEEAGARKRQISDSLKELDARKQAKRLTLEQRFERAGVEMTTQKFYLGSFALAAICALLAYAITRQPISLAGGAALGGLVLPNWILSTLQKKRMGRFIEEFPNAIDAIVRGIRSGLPLNDCFRLIANEAKEPVRSEFRSVVEAQALGVSIGEACTKIHDRVPLQEVNFFAIVIQIQSKSGGNLGEVLSNLSKVIRDRKKLRDKIAAMSTEAKASAGIIGALPFVVGILVYFGSPHYISLLWTTKSGTIAIGAALLTMLIGALVMRKMINFEV